MVLEHHQEPDSQPASPGRKLLMSYQGSRFRCKSKRDRLFTEDGYRCAYCLTDLWQLPIESRTVDHILPRKAGGTNDPTNLIAACHSCNSRRRDTPIGQFVGQET